MWVSKQTIVGHDEKRGGSYPTITYLGIVFDHQSEALPIILMTFSTHQYRLNITMSNGMLARRLVSQGIPHPDKMSKNPTVSAREIDVMLALSETTAICCLTTTWWSIKGTLALLCGEYLPQSTQKVEQVEEIASMEGLHRCTE